MGKAWNPWPMKPMTENIINECIFHLLLPVATHIYQDKLPWEEESLLMSLASSLPNVMFMFEGGGANLVLGIEPFLY